MRFFNLLTATFQVNELVKHLLSIYYVPSIYQDSVGSKIWIIDAGISANLK